jgi:hypothetical protein
MYWNNPLIETRWPSIIDPVSESMHNGSHCLFWNPAANFDQITTQQRLEQLCKWANDSLDFNGIDGFTADPRNHYDIANLVKLNMWVHDIRAQGIIKPWLLLDEGDGTFTAGTGDSRLRCLERIPEITTVSAFISTVAARRHLYQDLEQVTTFDRFAELCGAKQNQLFLFRLTDATAPYGIYWYEYDSDLTRSVTPGEQDAVQMFIKYYKQNTIAFTPEWFDLKINWTDYKV